MSSKPQKKPSGKHSVRSKGESGAGEGNRTLVVSLGSYCSTIELHPRHLLPKVLDEIPQEESAVPDLTRTMTAKLMCPAVE